MKAPKWLEELPLAEPPEDRWQVSLRPLSLTVEEPSSAAWQPHILLIVESGRGAVLGYRLLESDPDPDLVIDLFLATMSEPALGVPRRPRKIQTDRQQLLPALKELAAELGVPVETAPDLPELSYAIHAFEEFISQKPGLYSEAEGADTEVIGDFFTAAASFYRSACWKRISDSEPITLVFDEGELEAKYAVIMGNGGIVRGLALYDDAEDLEDLYYDDESVDPTELACTSLTFAEKKEISDEQWQEIKQNGWEVVSYKAVPFVTRTDALGPPRMPTMEQLRQLEAALYVTPKFIETLPRRADQRQPLEPELWEAEVGGEEKKILVGYGMFTLEDQDLPAEE